MDYVISQIGLSGKSRTCGPLLPSQYCNGIGTPDAFETVSSSLCLPKLIEISVFNEGRTLYRQNTIR